MGAPANAAFRGNDRFLVRRRLGAGGMGVVYEAYDRDHRKVVALKTLRELEPDALYRFKREFRALQDIEHPNLVRLGELIESGGRWMFTMELVAGADFATHVAPGGELDEPRLRDSLRQLAHALSALHAAGKVHRDIKPSNIRVTPEGRLVLLDFGVVSDRAATETTGDRIIGTVAYMAPEQALGRDITPAADWYAVGSMLYEVLTGRPPYPGTVAMDVVIRKRTERPDPPHQLAPDAPADLCALAEQLLEPKPADRPSEARLLALLGALNAPAAAPATPPPRTDARELPVLLGRDHELEQLRHAHQRALLGSATSVLVRGESGIGKSALVQRFLATLDDPDAVILTGRCYQRELVPYKAFDGVVDALAHAMRRLPDDEVAPLVPRNAALLPVVFPVLGRVAAIANAPAPVRPVVDPALLRERVFAALRELLFLLAERRPLIVAIDDLQWADRDSLLLLADLLRPPDPPPLLLIATARTGAPVELPGSQAIIDLGPLPDAAARALAEALVGDGTAIDPDTLASEAAGHPLFIAELARHAGACPERPHVRLDEAIWSRAERLPAAVFGVLELVCLANAPLPQAALRAASELDADRFDRALARLRTEKLVTTRGSRSSDPAEPYHDRIREAVASRTAAGDLARRHARLVAGIEEAGQWHERPEMLVRHLEAAGRHTDAAERARQAADRAAEGLALDRAAELYRTALRLGTGDRDARRELQRRLAMTLVDAGRGEEAADAFLAAADGASDHERLDCRAWATHQLLITGHVERGLAITRELLDEVDVGYPASPVRAALGVLVRRLWLKVRGYRWTRRDPADLDPTALGRLDVLRATAEGLAVIDPIRGAYFHARSLLLALRLGDLGRLGRIIGFEGIMVAAQRGAAIEKEHRLIEQLRRVFDTSTDALVEVGAMVADGIVAFFSGRFRAATEKLARAEAEMLEQPARPTMDLNNTRIFRLYALRQAGAFGEYWQLLGDYLRDAEARGDLYAETTLRRISTLAYLAHDRPNEAAANLDRTRWAPPSGGFHVQHWYELDGRAQIALYRGEAAAAIGELEAGFQQMARSLVLRINMLRFSSRWMRGRMALAAAASGEAEPSGRPASYWLRLARKMARKLERERLDQPRAMAELLRAGLARQIGDERRAAEHLRTAGRLAESDLPLVARAANRCRGLLIAGREGDILAAESEAWMTDAGIADPRRFNRIVTPGFDSPAK